MGRGIQSHAIRNERCDPLRLSCRFLWEIINLCRVDEQLTGSATWFFNLCSRCKSRIEIHGRVYRGLSRKDICLRISCRLKSRLVQPGLKFAPSSGEAVVCERCIGDARVSPIHPIHIVRDYGAVSHNRLGKNDFIIYLWIYMLTRDSNEGQMLGHC